MSDETVFALDEGENKRESMTKEQILAAIANAITTGQVTGDYTAFIEMIKEQNKGAGVKIWLGTQAELLALPEIDENTIYYVTDMSTMADLDAALTTLKQQLSSGDFKVGAADKATNVTTNINGKAITSIFETNGTTVRKATHAEAADKATNVTTNINGKAITSIFETNGTTVRKATHAETAEMTEKIKMVKITPDDLSLSLSGSCVISEDLVEGGNYLVEFTSGFRATGVAYSYNYQLRVDVLSLQYLEDDGIEIAGARIIGHSGALSYDKAMTIGYFDGGITTGTVDEIVAVYRCGQYVEE